MPNELVNLIVDCVNYDETKIPTAEFCLDKLLTFKNY